MKKNISFAILTAFMVLLASCQKTIVDNVKQDGYLSFSEFSLGLDESLITKADPAGDNYAVMILDAGGDEILRKSYKEIKNSGNQLSLPAGSYTLVARSMDEEVPMAAFERPVYGTSKEFTIEAAKVTSIGELVCTLVQCKVTVSYSEEFLASVTGAGSTKVTLKEGYPLEYALNADKTYEQQAGYFAVDGNTMTVVFSGSIDGKTQKMTRSFAGVAPKQWRQIKFVQKKNEQGQATFDIVISDLISDETLNNTVDANEEILGEDPDAPKGDGGITLDFDYEAGCDQSLTDLNNMVIVPVSERKMAIKLKAGIPNGILKFSVEVQSTSAAFNSALAAAGGSLIDLVNPSADNEIIFQVVPFPHGADLVGKTEVAFDLSAAQEAIVIYPGTHTFLMTIVDKTFCTKKIPVTMIVE